MTTRPVEVHDLAVEVIALLGPTASGKTAVAEAVAGRLGTDVVSADALQVYRELPILTNQSARPTRLVGIRSVAESMSVGEYAALAHAAIDDAVARRGAVVVVGGTGLYLRAAIAELDVPPPVPPEARARWESAYDDDPGAAHAELARRDPAAAARVDVRDRRRVVRALELAERGASLVPPRDRLWSPEHRRPTVVVGLHVPPQELERRIEARTRSMFAAGVVDEVHRALAGGVSPTAEKALGLREIATLPPAEAEQRLILRTRQYAAYQRKWLRRVPGLVTIDATRPTDEVADAVLEVARAR